MPFNSSRSDVAAQIRAAFASWGTDSAPFLALVADNVRWRIIGSTRVSGTHRSKQAFLDATSPLGARFKEPLNVKIVSVRRAGDTVFLQWEGRTRAVNGCDYEQTYCWVLRTENGTVVDVVVYLDTALVDEVFRE